MDRQLFATDKELREFPESKTDSSTVQDKTPSSKDINLMASDLPRSHTDLPKTPSRLPECKSKCKSSRNHRHKSQSKNSIVGHLAAQTNDHIDTKQEKLWVIWLTHETYLDQLVGGLVGPPPSEAHCSWSISLWSVSPVVQFLHCCPFISSLTWMCLLEPSHPRHSGMSTSASRLARTY